MIFESNYEIAVIKYLENIGYNYIVNEELMKIRKDYDVVILFDILEESIRKINKNISQKDLNAVIGKIRGVETTSLIKSNENANRYIKEGIKVKDETKDVTNTFKIVDFDNIENNNYIVTNQFKTTTKHINYNNQIPDIVIYINGLPVSIIELKNPESDTDSISDAFHQIKNYQDNMKKLFTWNICNVISNQHISRYGSLTSDINRFSNWRNLTDDSISNDEFFFKQLFNKEMILSIVKDFTFFTHDNKIEKKIAGYHQITGVLDTVNSVYDSFENKTNKAGIFWHTQGSGKSFSMIFLLRYLNNHSKKMTTIVVTDRTELDNQLSGSFMKASDFLGQEIKQITSIKDLKETLLNKKQNGIYLTTVQKFDESIGELSNRSDILVISDEAHRSHKNISGVLSVIEEEVSVVEKYGYAYHLRTAFPNASFLGFTGTPIENDSHQTKEIFGDYTSKYTMSDAQKDGFVVPITYESRHTQLKIVNSKKQELDNLYENVRKEALKNVDLKVEVQKNLNKKLQQMDIIIGDDDRIEEISKDFVQHYNKRKNLLKGKSIFVAYNREIAFKYYKEITRIAPELEKKIRLIMTANNQKDSEEMLRLIKNEEYKDDCAKSFKDPDNDFKIAIVVDMWLTGFDAPCLDTLYIDKPIKMHNLMQAIARVNRNYVDSSNDELIKEGGLIVDYIGLWSKLQEALSFYTTGDKSIELSEPLDIDYLKENAVKQTHHIYSEYLDNKIHLDSSKIDDSEYLYNIIQDIQRIVIGKKLKQEFVRDVKTIKSIFVSIVSQCSEEEKILMQLLITSRSMLIKRELGNIDIDMKVSDLKQKIADAITHNKTIIKDNVDGKTVSLTDIMNHIVKYEDIDPTDALEVDKKVQVVTKALKSIRAINMIKEEKLTNKLKVLLEKYDSGHITLEEFSEQLHNDVAKEIYDELNEFDYSEDNKIEKSFYSILLDSDNQTDYDKEKIRSITEKLYNSIDYLLTKRWTYNNKVKREVRATLYNILNDEGYPPDTSNELKEKLVQQLELQIDNDPFILKEEEY
ncbi:MAG: type I restriction endonuclease subunit R [Mycoplasmatales bacterium]